MSKNQSRIHPLSSQSADNNRAPPQPPPAAAAAAATCCCGCNSCEIFFLCLSAIMMMLGVLLLISSGISILEETVSFHVDNASLTQFDLTNNNNTLDYNLTFDIKATNPNGDYIRKMDYDEIEARAYYQDIQFESMNLMPFHQDHMKNRTTTLHTVFQGQSLVPSLGEYSKLSDRFYRDKSHASFDIQVEFSLTITYHNHFLSRIFDSSLDQSHYRINCDLRRVPLFNLSSSSINGSSSGSSSGTTTVGGSFRTKKCDVIFEKSHRLS